MVQGKKQLNSKPKFAEVVIGDNEAKEMRESAKVRNRRNPYLKLSYPNGVTLILPADISIEQLRAYLFCRDLDACKRAAMMYSLFGACKVLDKNPERWLCYVLKHIDSTPEDKYYTLLPEFWEDEEQ